MADRWGHFPRCSIRLRDGGTGTQKAQCEKVPRFTVDFTSPTRSGNTCKKQFCYTKFEYLTADMTLLVLHAHLDAIAKVKLSACDTTNKQGLMLCYYTVDCLLVLTPKITEVVLNTGEWQSLV